MRRRWIGFAIAFAMAGAGGFLFLGWGFAERTLHAKKWSSPDAPGAEVVHVTASDGAKLMGAWYAGGSSGRCVMLLHGIGGNRGTMARFARRLLAEGYSVLAPDGRAQGDSGGEFVTYGLLEKLDNIGWAHFMRGRGCSKIYGLGQSLGASVLIQAAAVEPAFSAVAAESPYADLLAVGEYRLDEEDGAPPALAKLVVTSGVFYARLFDHLDFREVDVLGSIARTNTPVLLIHGLSDSRTPPEESKKLAAANPRSSLWLVPGSGHIRASVVQPEEFWRRVLGWFQQHS